MTTLRRFRNADLPRLVQIWTAHFAASGIPSRITTAIFAQAILNRVFFQAEQLIVAIEHDQPVGMAHWMVLPQRPGEAVIPVICVLPGKRAEPTGFELLARCEQAARQAGCTTILGGTEPTHFSGYAGLSPLGPGTGILDTDRPAARWFMQSGYAPLHRIARYSVALASFRPPVDRSQMQMRRSVTVAGERALPEDWHLATALSHIDVERFTATTRGGEAVAWVRIFLSDPEAQVFPAGEALLAEWHSEETHDQDAAARYTISTTLQQLGRRGVQFVEAVATDRRPHRAVILRSLRFTLSGEGTVFSKQLG